MKTKILFLLCLFVGILLLPTQAQDKAKAADQYWEHSYAQGGVWCDGEMIDLLKGELRIHYVLKRFDNGLIKMRNISQYKGELTSTATGEVFKFNRMINYEASNNWKWTGIIHYSMKGDGGTKYSGKIHVDYSSGSLVFTELHAVCH